MLDYWLQFLCYEFNHVVKFWSVDFTPLRSNFGSLTWHFNRIIHSLDVDFICVPDKEMRL